MGILSPFFIAFLNSRDGDGNKDQENEGIRYRQTDREGVSYRDASHSKNMKGDATSPLPPPTFYTNWIVADHYRLTWGNDAMLVLMRFLPSMIGIVVG